MKPNPKNLAFTIELPRFNHERRIYLNKQGTTFESAAILGRVMPGTRKEGTLAQSVARIAEALAFARKDGGSVIEGPKCQEWWNRLAQFCAGRASAGRASARSRTGPDRGATD